MFVFKFIFLLGLLYCAAEEEVLVQQTPYGLAMVDPPEYSDQKAVANNNGVNAGNATNPNVLSNPQNMKGPNVNNKVSADHVFNFENHFHYNHPPSSTPQIDMSESSNNVKTLPAVYTIALIILYVFFVSAGLFCCLIFICCQPKANLEERLANENIV